MLNDNGDSIALDIVDDSDNDYTAFTNRESERIEMTVKKHIFLKPKGTKLLLLFSSRSPVTVHGVHRRDTNTEQQTNTRTEHLLHLWKIAIVRSGKCRRKYHGRNILTWNFLFLSNWLSWGFCTHLHARARTHPSTPTHT